LLSLLVNKKQDYIPEDEDEDEDEHEDEDEDEVSDDDKEFVGAAHEEPITYDKEDPPMTVGSSYPNMYEFKVALSQHAIKHEFEYNTVKSAPHRCTVYCSRKVEDKCPWRLHASSRSRSCTVVVRKNQSGFFPFVHVHFFLIIMLI
jgi:hypothetical protein